MKGQTTIELPETKGLEGPSPQALQRHLDYLLLEMQRLPFGEVRHFLGCARLALEDRIGGPRRRITSRQHGNA